MNISCGVYGEPESDENPLYVCHHCGMPVCERHGWTVPADDAFHASDDPVSRAAMHCPRCASEYHSGATRYHGWTDPRAARVARQSGALWHVRPDDGGAGAGR